MENIEKLQERKVIERNEVLKDFFGGRDSGYTSEEVIKNLIEYETLMVKYRCAIREVKTKLEVLNEELSLLSQKNPIENIQARIKRPYSIARKLRRMNLPLTVDAIQPNLSDVAGIRVICPFINDVFEVAQMFLKQDDVKLIQLKDYINHPKENGYRSLHLIIEIPVFFSSGKENIRVEIQIRTVGMDFWASLEHQIQYKNDAAMMDDVVRELKECADTIAVADRKMQQLKNRVNP